MNDTVNFDPDSLIPSKTISQLIAELTEAYDLAVMQENPSSQDLDDCSIFMARNEMEHWEIFNHPEDWFYQSVLEKVSSTDVIYDIGAGDLRLDLLLSQRVKHVYAVEINPTVISHPLEIIGWNMPSNLTVIIGNGFKLPIPKDVTTLVCLMIHRRHNFPPETSKLKWIVTDGKSLIFKSPDQEPNFKNFKNFSNGGKSSA